ncbi:transcriptional regulator [Enterococcus mundtii]|uniref:zinc ribbon domain-containing protein n=1 Tax=Enterococcus mundtii TaxID=53346 RepID=UPI000D3C60ED|nr:zinc ribbon domain-containing protein [Enterococcus mundtii]PTO38479.1 transcriptional regulator [Enterococcus mundtii]PTO45007.1 transcriptional regulator [Enterococcus mundtii]
METMTYCQSCGMPLDSVEVLGTNKNNSKNEEYCIYCFKEGAFLTDCTMEEMIEESVKHMSESGMLKEQGKTKEEAREFMHQFFPDLKRWKHQ